MWFIISSPLKIARGVYPIFRHTHLLYVPSIQGHPHGTNHASPLARRGTVVDCQTGVIPARRGNHGPDTGVFWLRNLCPPYFDMHSWSIPHFVAAEANSFMTLKWWDQNPHEENM